ncbi:DUF4166 domain-containing protein [Yoonia sp. 2307UL14-13]|uniref:DUF4166 domain-containing protein n=1 Tax=Yoonia sp. 2307UL14-13 TaxID=3126506 RepID=UPI0030A9649B
MRVVVLGGYGVFGARLVRLLRRDGHEVYVAGRSAQKARVLADEVGAQALVVDRRGDPAPLWAVAPDVVVDAAGPFHAYGDDPYALARACIAQGVHYLDLADDPAFCAGIGALDGVARATGVFALSGVSSVPAISSAAVAALAKGAGEIDTISSAILPGNRAPRGRAVVESILHQAGRPFDVILDCVPVPLRSWSQPETFDLGQRMVRRGWLLEVPDNRLFEDHFGARTVLFRAGLELGVMNWSLAAFSWLRGKLGFGVPRWLVSFVLFAAKLLWPFGTDEGGMSVAVTVCSAKGWQRHTWRLIARAGEGPYIPAVPARVVLRAPESIAPGARPAVAEVLLADLEAGMADLAVTTERISEEVEPLFQRQLPRFFKSLPDIVQAVHEVPGPRRWVGRGSVTRGPSLWARSIAWVFGFPPKTDDIPMAVTMIPEKDGERWTRQFGDQVFVSHLRKRGDVMTERFGPLTFTLGLHAAGGALHFPVVSGRCGPIPLPRFMLPQSVAREYAKEGRFRFDVALKAPLTGALIVHYRGWLERAVGSNPSYAAATDNSIALSGQPSRNIATNASGSFAFGDNS